MEIISIGSSSSGNSYIIKAGSTNLLLDVGLSATKIITALRENSLEPEDIDAVLITHEHIDHVRSVRAISKKCPNAIFFASQGTVNGCDSFGSVDSERIRIIASQESADIGDARVRCFGLSHDAREPIGYSIIANDCQLTVVTDTGMITDEIYAEMLTANMLVFEANHEENLLMYGDYPYSVKMRIKSDVGHLSNVTSAEVLSRLLSEREEMLTIMLAHLSDKNNTPYQARATIENILRECGYVCGADYNLCIALKEGCCNLSF